MDMFQILLVQPVEIDDMFYQYVPVDLGQLKLIQGVEVHFQEFQKNMRILFWNIIRVIGIEHPENTVSEIKTYQALCFRSVGIETEIAG